MPLSKQRDRDRKQLARLESLGVAYLNRSCYTCGYDRVVDIHHIDSDRENNSPENLVDLCPSCHALITRGLNTLEGLLKEYDIEQFVQPVCNLEEEVSVQPRVYHRELHHTYEVGEVVLVRRGTRMVEMVVPELDADGRVISD